MELHDKCDVPRLAYRPQRGGSSGVSHSVVVLGMERQYRSRSANLAGTHLKLHL
jgi:hypothetical protein